MRVTIMKNHTRLDVLVRGLGILLAAAPVFAQVSYPAENYTGAQPFSNTYDSKRKIKLTGPVTRVDWSNPNAFFFVNVRDAGGKVTNWAVECGNPIELERDGWNRFSLQIGDVVSVDGIPARTAKQRAFATSVVLNRTGKKLFAASAANKKKTAAASAAVPRWPDGRPRLGPPPGQKGYWGTPSATALIESTATGVRMNRDGLLANIADAGKVAPFQPWAKALYEYRQRNLLKDDPYSRCIPPGGPRQFQMPNGFQFVEQPQLGRILVLLGGGDRNWRMIFTDGRPLGTVEDMVLTYYGNSVGRWDKDTLVVDTVGFNERFWLSNGGLPSTEALHTTERFTRTDLNTLKYQVTVDDPRTYTRPWTAAWNIQWVPGEDIQEYFCEENVESTLSR